MLGATVMPHAVYLHSGLARDRHGQPDAGAPRRRLLRITRYDVGIAMLVAGAVNLAMLLVAATNHGVRLNLVAATNYGAGLRNEKKCSRFLIVCGA